jgi:hypothetical protein
MSAGSGGSDLLAAANLPPGSAERKLKFAAGKAALDNAAAPPKIGTPGAGERLLRLAAAKGKKP